MYLAQFIAKSGICSRRQAIEAIKNGLVQVEGILVKDPTVQVTESSKVSFGGKPVEFLQNTAVKIIFFKPSGLICSNADELGRPTVFDYLRRKGCSQKLFCVGRLDYDTRGLLLLTNDGDWCNKMTHPRFEVQKEYIVSLDRPFSDRCLRELRKGIQLEDGFICPDAVDRTDPYRIRIVLHSGRNRIVRRIFGYFEYHVVDLLRTRFASYTLAGLQEGSFRAL